MAKSLVRVSLCLALTLSSTACDKLMGESDDEPQRMVCSCAAPGLEMNGADQAAWRDEYDYDSDVIYQSQASLAGHLSFSEWPASLDGARAFFYVDEVSPYADEPTRIIEKEFDLTATQEPWACDQQEEDYVPQGGVCDCYMELNSAPYLAPGKVEVSTQFDASYVGPVPFQVSFTYPDSRSRYLISFLIDMDGDGAPSEGDYVMNAAKDVNHLDGETDLLLDLEVVSPLPDEESIQATATIVDHSEVEGCEFVLQLEDGNYLEPTILAEDLKIDGTKVEIVYRPYGEIATTCMAGPVVQLESIEPVAQPSDDP